MTSFIMTNTYLITLEELYFKYFQEKATTITEIPIAGSDRHYFRMQSEHNRCIGTYNFHITENKSFIYFAQHFKSKNINVPEVYIYTEDYRAYLQEDVGSRDLFYCLQNDHHSEATDIMIRKSLSELVRMQIIGHQNLDYSYCFNGTAFDYNAILADLFYFKYYFLRPQKIEYDGQAIVMNFQHLAQFLLEAKSQYFMMRDFQSRNILVENEKVFLIDFQGGKLGPLQYDIISFLWQARGGFTMEEREKYLQIYIDEVKKVEPNFDEKDFRKYYDGFLLIRLLQVLGSYGYRGIFEKRAHFLASIPLALSNIEHWLNTRELPIDIQALLGTLRELVSPEIANKYKPTTSQASDLVVEINSFSYKVGLPVDESGNGGGYIFDCRPILNPGRLEPYKLLTGRDRPVQEFLLTKTKMPAFLDHVFAIADHAVQSYIERDFHHLQINFGCTGGQHRSVFAADQTAQYLEKKYGVKIVLKHIEQEKKNWVNTLDTEKK